MAKIDTILGDLRKLQAARATLENAFVADEARLAELKASLGDAELAALLDGGDASEVRNEIYLCQVRLDGATAARPKLLARIRESLQALGHERAEVVRAKSKALGNDFAKHEANVAKLKLALESAAGCRYEQAVYDIEPGKNYAMGELPHAGMSFSQQKQAEINGLLAEAVRIEKASTHASQGGRREGATVEDLLTVANDIEAIGPTKTQIIAWASAALANANQEWERTLLDYSSPLEVKPVRAVSFDLNWNSDGQITPASRVHNRIQRGIVNKAA